MELAIQLPGKTEETRRGCTTRKSSLFYKTVDKSILQQKKLRIPEEFVQKYGDELSAVATLTVTNGCHIWYVQLKKIGHKLWFHDGWPEFVEHHHIWLGFFLVFAYIGDSSFVVYIFDLAAPEINCPNYTLSPNRISPPHLAFIDVEDDEVTILGSSTSLQSQVSSRNNVIDRIINQRSISKNCVPLSLENLEKSLLKSGSQINQHDSSNYLAEDLNFGIEVSSSESKEASNLHDNSLNRIKKSNQYLAKDDNKPQVPQGPSLKYMPNNFSATAVDDPMHKAHGENTHQLKLALTPTAGIQNETSSSEFKTYMDNSALHISDLLPETCAKGKEENMSNADVCQSSTKRIREEQFPNTKESRRRSSRRRRAVTSWGSSSRALHAADMYEPENPFCRVTLHRSYACNGTLYMPSGFAKRYLNGVGEKITLQVSGAKKWPVGCLCSNNSCRLTTGWTSFVVENQLEEGDVCVFEVIKLNEVVLKVTIFRAVDIGSY